MGVPFQDGFLTTQKGESLVFTDYRWNNGKISRRWYVDPASVNLDDVKILPFSPDRSG